MAAITTPQATRSDLTVLREPSYSQIVWGQFRKNRIAYGAFWAFILLALLAIGAPLISLDQPFWARVRFESGQTKIVFPWAESLLFNRNVFGQGIDIFFNLLLVMLPFVLIAWLVFRRVALRDLGDRRRRQLRRRFFEVAGALFAVCFGILLAINPARTLTDWKQPPAWMRPVATELAARGQLPSNLVDMTRLPIQMVDGVAYPEVIYQTAEGPVRTALLSAVFPPLNFSYAETGYDINERSGGEHLLGTDESGRDLFVRMLYGTRLSLTIGVIAVSIYCLIGVILGALAGYMGRRTDLVISRFIEVVMVFPPFILILTFVSFLPSKSIFWIMLIIGVTRWTTVARLVRGEFLKLRQSDFVQAAIAQGLQARRVVFRHILPNAMGPVLVTATFGVADAILIEAALSFLGVSDLAAPSWGRILSVGRAQHDLFTMLLPGLAIFVTVSVLNQMGEGLRDALDPKLRK